MVQCPVDVLDESLFVCMSLLVCLCLSLSVCFYLSHVAVRFRGSVLVVCVFGLVVALQLPCSCLWRCSCCLCCCHCRTWHCLVLAHVTVLVRHSPLVLVLLWFVALPCICPWCLCLGHGVSAMVAKTLRPIRDIWNLYCRTNILCLLVFEEVPRALCFSL